MSHARQEKSVLARLAWRIAADRCGQTAVITAIVLVLLVAFCGLAVDVVMWEVNHRAMQGAADQAALAGATAYRNRGQTGPLGDSAAARNAAYATAIRSGYPADAITVAAYNNASSCTNNGCLKVTINQQQPLYFTGIFLKSNPTATASAVGTCSGCSHGSFNVASTGGTACVMALETSGKGVITASGTPVMSLNQCNLYNNSPATNATILDGGAMIEGCSATNPCGSKALLAQPNVPVGHINIPVVTSAAPAPDPYAGMQPPAVSSPCQTSFPANPVPSGTYCVGNITDQSVTFATGAVIVLESHGGTPGLSTKGNSTLAGTGVTLYVLGGGSINANSTVNISAPTTGPYAGISVWFGDSSAVSWAGTNGSSFKGAIYAPTADVTYTGNALSASSCTRLIGASVSLSGTSIAKFDNSGCPIVTGPTLTSSGVSGSTTHTGSPMLVE